jgi:4-hydroxybenzoate polyprenyltransferase
LVDASVGMATHGLSNVTVLSRKPSLLRAMIKQLRPHQWAKNGLVVLPALLAPRFSLDHIVSGLIGAAAFSLCASAGYVFNDLLDLEADRAHRTKKDRPLASGALPVALGPPLFLGLLAGSLGLSLWLGSVGFTTMLVIYFIATLTYSFYLKRLALLDVLVLAWLYTHRILSGALATSVPLSAWLLAFSMFLFLSLAFVKRFVELSALKDDATIKHRDYARTDIPMVANMGIASGYIAVLVFSLYVDQGARSAAYAQPVFLWFSVPVLLYWVSRIWILAGRGQLEDDPVKFALRDKVSLTCGAVLVLLAMLARYAPAWFDSAALG